MEEISYKHEDRLTAIHITVAIVAVFVGSWFGPLQVFEHAGIDLYAYLAPGIKKLLSRPKRSRRAKCAGLDHLFYLWLSHLCHRSFFKTKFNLSLARHFGLSFDDFWLAHGGSAITSQYGYGFIHHVPASAGQPLLLFGDDHCRGRLLGG